MSVGYIPQIKQMLRTKSSKGLNFKSFGMIFLGILLYEVYAIYIVACDNSGHMYLITNSLSLILSGAMCVLIKIFRNDNQSGENEYVKEKREDKVPCGYCFNARVCPPSDDLFDTPLTDENDFSSRGIGDCEKGFRLSLNSGYGRPVNIEVEKWYEEDRQWHAIGLYKPKYCPECGRILNEYEKEE